MLNATEEAQSYLDDHKETLSSDVYNTISLRFKQTHDALTKSTKALYRIRYSYQKLVTVPYIDKDDDEGGFKIVNTLTTRICVAAKKHGSIEDLVMEGLCREKWLTTLSLPYISHNFKGEQLIIYSIQYCGHMLFQDASDDASSV